VSIPTVYLRERRVVPCQRTSILVPRQLRRRGWPHFDQGRATATACQVAGPLYGPDWSPSQRGLCDRNDGTAIMSDLHGHPTGFTAMIALPTRFATASNSYRPLRVLVDLRQRRDAHACLPRRHRIAPRPQLAIPDKSTVRNAEVRSPASI
jgi:hypothetical protein